MKRRFQGLGSTAQASTEVPDGVFLVRVDQVRYSRERQKPFYAIRFSVIEPEPVAGRTFSGRLYCTPKALWKLSWFLRDFSYDPELLGRDEVEEKGQHRKAILFYFHNNSRRGMASCNDFVTAGEVQA